MTKSIVFKDYNAPAPGIQPVHRNSSSGRALVDSISTGSFTVVAVPPNRRLCMSPLSPRSLGTLAAAAATSLGLALLPTAAAVAAPDGAPWHSQGLTAPSILIGRAHV